MTRKHEYGEFKQRNFYIYIIHTCNFFSFFVVFLFLKLTLAQCTVLFHVLSYFFLLRISTHRLLFFREFESFSTIVCNTQVSIVLIMFLYYIHKHLVLVQRKRKKNKCHYTHTHYHHHYHCRRHHHHRHRHQHRFHLWFFIHPSQEFRLDKQFLSTRMCVYACERSCEWVFIALEPFYRTNNSMKS